MNTIKRITAISLTAGALGIGLLAGTASAEMGWYPGVSAATTDVAGTGADSPNGGGHVGIYADER
ncbi:hypothetical protein [Nonomuraea turcica]|uniref:hypothetical protein n=1 Tax=Nonomuraea sp. G32 TaxID=3067274 RepID=UPI00273AF618|nr:hypothetical protein [Nonomuraea sp. G32]MDP4505304.1 hypothetical protein [Nonomuraea sp. G32]